MVQAKRQTVVTASVRQHVGLPGSAYCPGRFVSPPICELESLRTPLTEGERRVLDFFLEVLPLSWEIYLQPHLNGLRPDFVLLHPRNGIAVFEVKDWDLDAMDYFVQEGVGQVPRLMGRKDGRSFSLVKQDPVAKVSLYKDEIFDLYCPSLPSGGGFGSIVAGIIFPFATTDAAKNLLGALRKHHGHDKFEKWHPIVGMDLLAARNPNVIKRSVLPSLQTQDPRMGADAAADLRPWLVEPEFSAEQRRPLLLEMSPRQRSISENKDKVGFRRIRGPAGSGKSLVLAARAAQLAREGKRVLVVTFNITLINYLLDLAVRYAQSGAVRKQIVALNYHQWCKRLAAQTGHKDEYKRLWEAGRQDVVLAELLPVKAKSWTRDLDDAQRWDAILVDEGQDFRPSWWGSLRSALGGDGTGEMLLCADSAQNVYDVVPWTGVEMVGAGFRGKWLELDTSYRMPSSLCALAKRFVEQFLPNVDGPPPEPPQGRFDFKTQIRWQHVAPEAAAKTCVESLLAMIQAADPPLAYADLVCMVDSAEVGRHVIKLLNKHGIKTIHTFGIGDDQMALDKDSRRKKLAFYKGDARVKVTTVHCFKGLESKAVVLQVSRASTAGQLALAYSGLTRLKWDDLGCYLTIVNSTPELRAFSGEANPGHPPNPGHPRFRSHPRLDHDMTRL